MWSVMPFRLEPVSPIAAEVGQIHTRKDTDRPGNEWRILVENMSEDEPTIRDSTAIYVSWWTGSVLRPQMLRG